MSRPASPAGRDPRPDRDGAAPDRAARARTCWSRSSSRSSSCSSSPRSRPADRRRPPVDFLLPGALALAVIATSLVNLGIATAYERNYGVLKRLGGSPLTRGGLLAAKIGAVLVVEVAQVVLLVAIAVVALGWRPGAGGVAGAASSSRSCSGRWRSPGLGLLLAGALRAEATLALANGLFLGFLLLGGIVLPVVAPARAARRPRRRPAGRGPRRRLPGGARARPPATSPAVRRPRRLGRRRRRARRPDVPLGVARARTVAPLTRTRRAGRAGRRTGEPTSNRTPTIAAIVATTERLADAERRPRAAPPSSAPIGRTP